ncbi:hypothetical protein AUC61_13250 [Pseudomonas sp. S25]|uniref:Uncharacterized protein n=1 Tax=Pseudomonas maioricensis TaxID=1766623 RepID=A0ABS9ZJV6_9PSED|nr:hypothetical protein [Pseudomonas sp. S25]MCI8210502.1 hypothetical protein [Pseudomonas sp. S25]
MNIALSVLNAAALVALVAFHFQDDGKAEQTALQAQPHHLLRQAPQLAIMTDRSSHPQAVTLANDNEAPASNSANVRAEPRWVF